MQHAQTPVRSRKWLRRLGLAEGPELEPGRKEPEPIRAEGIDMPGNLPDNLDTLGKDELLALFEQSVGRIENEMATHE